MSVDEVAERWRPVRDFEGLYEISDRGRLRGSLRQGSNGSVLALQPNKPCGYMRTRLYKDGIGYSKKLHRLVLEAFAGPCPEGFVGRHKNGDRADNRIENLAWGSYSENFADSVRHGTATLGERNGCAKLTRKAVEELRRLRSTGISFSKLADKFGISPDTARSAAIGDTWR